MVRWIGLLARLVVGGVWIWAGALKLPHLESSVTAVRAYQLLPTSTTDTVGRLLPLVEVAVGVLLVLGLLTRVSGLVSALLLIAFIVGISSVWARGISINCGCFGDGGYDPNAAAKYPWEIARDTALALGSLLLVWRPRTPASLDGLLFPQRDVAAEPVTADT
ncbi:MauE/DoxX family redox-associated membrane protein [Nocardioides mangrovicus]|nr:MauE/DoxX family redox-associated membrane protein [Nocardioides mangrovicus]